MMFLLMFVISPTVSVALSERQIEQKKPRDACKKGGLA
jgi:hypothetical protein